MEKIPAESEAVLAVMDRNVVEQFEIAIDSSIETGSRANGAE